MKHIVARKTALGRVVSSRYFGRKSSLSILKQTQQSDPANSTVDRKLLDSFMDSQRVMDVFERMKAKEKQERSLILMAEILRIMKKKEVLHYSHLLTTMGYYIHEKRDSRGGHKLVKKTQNLTIEVHYQAKENKSNEVEQFMELMTQNLNNQTFAMINRKFGGAPDPGMDLYERHPQFPNPAIKNPEAVKLGHDKHDDITEFQIALIKNQQVLYFLCWSHNGDIHIKNIFCGDPETTEYKGPSFTTLSKPLQTQLLHYLYSLGVYPEVALCVEYLSINKEQRLYMRWVEQLLKYAKQQRYNQ